MKKGKFKFLIGISFFLLFMGTATLSFSQYQTVGDEKDTLSTTQERGGETSGKQKLHDPRKASMSKCLRECALGCIEDPLPGISLGDCLSACDDSCP